ncbi:hypothetical protein [Maridesulfovibrio zosterae]|uniref:hypothetical protein n=1 Tax=Maridesulfovibrio zosterae TaxID=82171 RepID=UPI000417282F|nr:hypothetical protein [Maridesulfovibrio zosterae]
MLLAASSAWAINAQFPKALNGTYTLNINNEPDLTVAATAKSRTFTGFTANGTLGDAELMSFNSTFIPFNSTNANSKIFSMQVKTAAAGTAGNSTISTRFGFFNSTADATGTAVIDQNNGTGADGIGNATLFRANQAVSSVATEEGAQINGIITMLGTNSSLANAAGDDTQNGGNTLEPVRFIASAGTKVMAGISNSTLSAVSIANGISGGDNPIGTTFMMSYENGTVVDAIFDGSTWSYYCVGYDYGTELETFYGFGQVKLNSVPGSTLTNNAQARIVYYNDDTSLENDHTAKDYMYNATAIAAPEGTLKIVGDGAGGQYNLFDYAVINKERNLITGVVTSLVDSASNTNRPARAYAVMVKNAKSIDAADLTNRAYKMVYSGWGSNHGSNNATQGIMAASFDENLNVRGGLVYNSPDGRDLAGPATFNEVSVSLDGYAASVAETNDFKSLTQSNMTLTASNTAKLTGNFYGKFSAAKDYAVGIYQPADGNEEVSGFGIAFLVPDTAVVAPTAAAGKDYQSNGTIVTDTTNYTQRFVNNSTDYSGDDIRARWTSIPSSFVPVTPAVGFNSTISGVSEFGFSKSDGSFYQTFQIEITGLGGNVKALSLYKLMGDSTSSTKLAYASSIADGIRKDGYWWISDNANGGYRALDSDLEPTENYYVNYVLKDNGLYDAMAGDGAGQYLDPVVLGYEIEDSSSSSGCVFNPAAGFGLEWLLLMLAPLVAVVRSRFKK